MPTRKTIPERLPRPTTLAKRLSLAWRGRDELRRHLHRPATASQLARAEKALGVKLPGSLVALYKAHNGTGHAAIDGSYRLLSLDRMVKSKRVLDELASNGHFDHWREGDWWSTAWVPFLELEGDRVCLDTASGEIVEFVANRPKRLRQYPSAHAWLHTLAQLTLMAPHDEPLADFLTSRAAARKRAELNPGFPVRRTARPRPEPRRSKRLMVDHQSFDRGDYYWTIVRAGPFVRTMYGRANSARLSSKGFPNEARAKKFVDKSIERKLAQGYVAQIPMASSPEDFLGILELARRHMRTLKKAES